MYISLYRKYRPKFFSDVVGQEVSIKTLKNSIINNSFGHAYLFEGQHGTGKTTLSKIFARSVNCLTPVDGEACGKCSNCLQSFDNNCVDIIEIDAASNNGVEEIRQLKNNVSIMPSFLKYKVYIIDEVHMLSTSAFNALLKTLEEPPSHVIFILATTDVQKIPDTIVSRCIEFEFNSISINSIISRLKLISEQENILVDDDVLNIIASNSSGAMRDALTSLDKLSNFTSEKISIDDYYLLNGLVESTILDKLYSYIFSYDSKSFLDLYKNITSCGKNIILVFEQFISYLNNKLESFYLNNKNLDFDSIIILKFILNYNDLIGNIRKSYNPSLYIQTFILKFINDHCSTNLSNNVEKNNFLNDSNNDFNKNIVYDVNKKNELSNNNDNVDKNIENNSNLSNSDSNNHLFDYNVPVNINDIMHSLTHNTLIDAKKKYKIEVNSNINSLKDSVFNLNNGYLASSLLDGNVCCASDKYIVLSFNNKSDVDRNILNLNKLNNYYNDKFNTNFEFVIIDSEYWNYVSNEYIKYFKNNQFNVIDVPKPIFENNNNNDIISNKAISIFGDIVELK